MTENRSEAPNNKSRMPDTSTRAILKTAAPILFGLLLEQLIGMTDAIFLGRVGEIELGAAAIGSVVFLFFISQGLGYSIGAQSLMARANGRLDREAFGLVFRQAGIFMTGLGVLIALVLVLGADLMMGFIAKSPQVAHAAADYVFWRGIGMPFAFAAVLLRAFFIAILQTRILTWSSAVMVATNCILNGILIFGVGPVPALGIAGAAIASALSELACVLFLGAKIVRSGYLKKYRLLGTMRPAPAVQRRLFSLGRWLMLQEAVSFGVWIYFFGAVEHVSERALAISNVVRQLGSIVFLFVHAFGTTCGSIAANLYGRGRTDLINGLAKRGLALSFAAMTPVLLIFAVFPEWVLGWFTNIEAVVEASVPAFYVMLASYFVSTPPFFYFFMIGALGYARPSFVTCIVSSVIYAGYVGFITAVTTNVAVIWTSDTVYGMCLGIGTWFIWRHTEWSRKRGALTLHPQGEAER